MAAENHHGTPVSTSEGYGGPRDHMVTYADDAAVLVTTLRRPDLMKLAGAMARDRGLPFAGIKNSNEELLEIVRDGTPWTRELPAPKPRAKSRTPKPDGNGAQVNVKCSCGHDYWYHVKGTGSRAAATVAWLESKPCPRCAKKAPKPGDPKPGNGPDVDFDEPDNDEPEPDAPKPKRAPKPVELDLDALADQLVGRIQERMSPIQMPELHHELLPKVLKLMQARGGNGQRLNLWLQGPPGTGKSTIPEQAAAALGLDFHALSCTETMPESKLMGFIDAGGNEHRTPFMDAYENGGVFLLDELDSGNSNLIGGLNSAISNGHCSFAGRTIQRHADSIILASANTAGGGPEAGYLGNNGVSKATLDRFTMIHVPIDEALEDGIVEAVLPADTAGTLLRAVRSIRRAVEARGLHIVVSPRTSYDAAIMIRAGFSLEDSLKAKCLFSLDDATTSSLLGGV